LRQIRIGLYVQVALKLIFWCTLILVLSYWYMSFLVCRWFWCW